MRSSAALGLLVAFAGTALAQTAEPDPVPPPSEAPPPPPEPPTEPPPPAPTTTTATTTTTTTTVPPPAPAAPPKPPKPFDLYRARRSGYVGIELGVAHTADDRNLFGNGWGRVLVIAVGRLEMRPYEYYDLEDRGGMLGNSEGGRGRLAITSVGYRLHLADVGPLHVNALLGGAWIRRPTLRVDPDDINSSYVLQTQWGIAAMGGIAANLFGLIQVELRAYPTYWDDLTGSGRYVVEQDGAAPTSETIMESPGGIPTTFTVGLGYAW